MNAVKRGPRGWIQIDHVTRDGATVRTWVNLGTVILIRDLESHRALFFKVAGNGDEPMDVAINTPHSVEELLDLPIEGAH